MKKVILLIAIGLIVVSCKKDDIKDCKCGIVDDHYKEVVHLGNPNKPIYESPWKIVVINNCSGAKKEFKTDSEDDLTGTIHCAKKKW